MEKEIRIRVPYLYEPRPYQLPILQSQSQNLILVMHRKGGKTKTILNRQIRKMVHPASKKGLYLYLFPQYSQAKKVIWQDPEMMQHFPQALIEKKNDSELYIKTKTGCMWLLGGADNPDSWRGTNPVDIVFDEYAEMKEEIWTAFARPVFAVNGGSATFVFTPKGDNHAHKLLQYAKKAGPEWDTFVLDAESTGAIPQKDLDAAKAEMPLALYEQEFMCKFLEGANQVFRRLRENTWDGNLQILPGKIFQLGVDLAKAQDWTVITPFDMHTFKAGNQERFNQIDWNLQEAKIEAAHLRFNKGLIRVDSTGVGDPIFENLQRKGLYVEPFHFTEESRRNLLINLAIKLEQDLIKIPNDEGLIEELQGARYEVGERGRMRIAWPDSASNDRVMSLALAVWNAKNKLHHASVFNRSSEFSKDYESLPASRFHFDS